MRADLLAGAGLRLATNSMRQIMNIYASPSMQGFYTDDIHGANMPMDAVEITEQQWMDLINGQASGKIINWDTLTLINPPAPSASDVIKRQITALESTATPRRVREAVLGIDNGWLKSLNDQIAALRAQLGA